MKLGARGHSRVLGTTEQPKWWVSIFVFTLVAEQAESIDNPLHEAAKRGRSDSLFLF